jgi:hypothetical protein
MLSEKVKNMPRGYIYTVLVGLLVVLLLVAVFKKDNNDNENVGSEVNLVGAPTQELSSNIESSTSSAVAATTTIKKITVPVKTSSAPLSATQRYLDAIRLYKNVGYYFQFVDCHGLPGSLTLKKGKKFMLDNRDNKSHKIAIVGGQSFTIGAYNFAIATAPSKAGTHYITCDGGGAASILVQQ